MALSDKEREWRSEMCERLAVMERAILAINGPYAETTAALRALRDLSDAAIDDEDIGPCAHCSEHIWSIAGDDCVSSEDGETFCMACVARWNDEAAEAAT